MASFKDLPNIFETAEAGQPSVEEATGAARLVSSEQNSPLVRASVRVFGKPSVPVMVDLATRSVYPIKG